MPIDLVWWGLLGKYLTFVHDTDLAVLMTSSQMYFPNQLSHSVNWYKVWTLGIEPSWYYKFSLKVAQNGFLIFKN